MKHKIYACPWCGENPEVKTNESKQFTIKCEEEDCPVQPGLKKYYPTIDEAVSDWNGYVFMLDETIEKLQDVAVVVIK